MDIGHIIPTVILSNHRINPLIIIYINVIDRVSS